jgi:hypothetical protein
MESRLDKTCRITRFILKQGELVMTKHFTFEVLDDDGILRDGETRTHRMMMRDSATKTNAQIALDATEALKVRDAAIFAASRRPGFVYDSTLDSQATARAAARQASYDEYSREVSNAWRRKHSDRS